MEAEPDQSLAIGRVTSNGLVGRTSADPITLRNVMLMYQLFCTQGQVSALCLLDLTFAFDTHC